MISRYEVSKDHVTITFLLPDTSAILTMMNNEEGADVIEGILRTKEILLPAIVLLEIYYKTIQKRGMKIAK